MVESSEGVDTVFEERAQKFFFLRNKEPVGQAMVLGPRGDREETTPAPRGLCADGGVVR